MFCRRCIDEKIPKQISVLKQLKNLKISKVSWRLSEEKFLVNLLDNNAATF